jgi:2-hydroxychromene-2-carboxylate isomerase
LSGVEHLCHRVIPEIEERTGEKFNHIPCLLGGIFKSTGNQSPFLSFANVKGKVAYELTEMNRFIAKHALTKFRQNPHFPVNTLLMMRAAVAAQMDGVHADYMDAGMQAMWEQGLKMDDPEVFVRAMNAADLDGQRLLARSQEPDVKQVLLDTTSVAVARGAFGIPTFFVGDEMFFGKERLSQIETEIVKQKECT